jgi:hypothetical protein
MSHPVRTRASGTRQQRRPDVAAWGAAETLELDLAGLPAAMVHDSGPAAGRAARLHRRAAGPVRAFSQTPGPGSRRHPHLQSRIADPRPQGTFGLLRIDDRRLVEARIIPVDT